MANLDEIAFLEAERDRLRSMIAYHNGPFYRTPPGPLAPAWMIMLAFAVVGAIGALLVAALFAAQISLLGFVFLVAGLPLLAYILSRRTMILGAILCIGDTPVPYPLAEPAGEPEVRQRLADCEARIKKLKEGHR